MEPVGLAVAVLAAMALVARKVAAVWPQGVAAISGFHQRAEVVASGFHQRAEAVSQGFLRGTVGQEAEGVQGSGPQRKLEGRCSPLVLQMKVGARRLRWRRSAVLFQKRGALEAVV